MDRINVSSSNIASIGYDSTAQVLEIKFHDGRIYQYDGVPEHEYQGMMNASSHGQYLHQRIKDKYSYRKIR